MEQTQIQTSKLTYYHDDDVTIRSKPARHRSEAHKNSGDETIAELIFRLDRNQDFRPDHG